MTICSRPGKDGKKRYPKAAALLKLVFTCAVAVCVLAGCGTTAQTGPAQQTGTPSSSAAASPEEETPNPSYEIVSASFQEDTIHIRYPQLMGLGDEAKEQEVNDLIKNDIWDSQVEQTLNAYREYGEEITLHLDLDYEVAWNTNELLSVVYTGSAYVEGGAHPDQVFHGLTLDLETGKRLYLSDFTEIDAGLVEKLKKSIADGDLIGCDGVGTEALQPQDERDIIWYLKQESESNFYVTQDALAVSMDVCHAAGDFVVVELPGRYTPDRAGSYDGTLCLDTENPLISFRTESGKTVSICASKDGRYLVYRFGTQGGIELEYPEDKAHSWDQFTYSNSLREGENGGADLGCLSFEHGGYRYEVYQRHGTAGGETELGVRVTELASGKKTDIRGVADSLIGYWYDLAENKNLRTAAP